jgi:hypothetical protein
MLPIMITGRELEHAEEDPVLAAFNDAPLSDEPETEEEPAADLEAIEDYRTGRVRMCSGAEVHAEVEAMARATAAE